MTDLDPGDDVELTLEGEVAEVIKPPHRGSTRYRIETDATAFPLIVYEHHVKVDVQEVGET